MTIGKKSKVQESLRKSIDLLDEKNIKIPTEVYANMLAIKKEIECLIKKSSMENKKGKVLGVFSKSKKQSKKQQSTKYENECADLMNKFNAFYDFYVLDSKDSAVKSKIDKKKKELAVIINKHNIVIKGTLELGKDEKIDFGVKQKLKTYQEAMEHIQNELNDTYKLTDTIEQWKRELKEKVKKNDKDESVILAGQARMGLKNTKKTIQSLEACYKEVFSLGNRHLKGHKYREDLNKRMDELSATMVSIKEEKDKFFDNCNRIIKFGEYIRKGEGNVQFDFSPLIKIYGELADCTGRFALLVSGSLCIKLEKINSQGDTILAMCLELKNTYQQVEQNKQNNSKNLFKLENRENRIRSLDEACKKAGESWARASGQQVKIDSVRKKINEILHAYKKEHSPLGIAKKTLKIISEIIAIANSVLMLIRNVTAIVPIPGI